MEQLSLQDDFWNDAKKAQDTLRELNEIRDKLAKLTLLTTKYDDLSGLLEMAVAEDDLAFLPEIEAGYEELKKELEAMELMTLLKGEYDSHNVYLSIHPGAGGTESQDWASMLLRMYTRWAERKGYKVDLMELLPGDEAGIKSATLHITGEYAYAYLKGEKGVHRLVRISPFDAAGRRHTSFASVSVLPEVQQDTEIELDLNDVRIDTYRASGAGGQHVNKTDSAVRLTHLPTGIVVQCQNERSQHKNKETAFKILKSRLLELKLREQEEQLNALSGEKGEIAWGNQIRSYVF
ncbi:MAG TPA: peptide chain release factor 2, partial [Firmicutes bacterium]|nr:peptide chain release factor 2 [Bacillota bacterium]